MRQQWVSTHRMFESQRAERTATPPSCRSCLEQVCDSGHQLQMKSSSSNWSTDFCNDSVSFADAKGRSCVYWASVSLTGDCYTLAIALGYTATQTADIINNCPISCSACGGWSNSRRQLGFKVTYRLIFRNGKPATTSSSDIKPLR